MKDLLDYKDLFIRNIHFYLYNYRAIAEKNKFKISINI